MEVYEVIYQVLQLMLDYVKPAEKETAVFEVLNFLYDEDICDINELKMHSDSEEDEWLSKKIKTFIKENGLDEEEEEDW